MNVELLAVLNEALDELTEQQRLFHVLIEQYQGDVGRNEENLRFEESQRTYYEEQRRKVSRKSELLRNYLTSLEKQPCALLKKVTRLREEQSRIDQALRQVGDRVASARSTMQQSREQLAQAEQRSEEIRKEWSEVSQHISLVERNS